MKGIAQRGLGAITIIVVLVVLAGLAAAIVRLNVAAQSMAAQDVLAARAAQSARAGLQWGLYQALKGSWTTCSGADGTLNSSGDGKGTLYRLKGYGFNSSYPGACPAATGADVLASNVKSCRFIYDPSLGATQQYGFVSLQLELARNSEAVSLVFGANIMNTP